MSTNALSKTTGMRMPVLFNDLFKPWNEWFDNGGEMFNRSLSIPAVNIMEEKDFYKISLAAPGMKKNDFQIDVEGNLLSISCEKEETTEEKEKKFTRKEYNYSSFSRSFTMPDEINFEKIEARYEDGVLNLVLPKKEEFKKVSSSKHIAVK